MAKQWKLAPDVAKDTQAIVTAAVSTLEYGVALFLELPKASGGTWLHELLAKAPVTAAANIGSGQHVTQAISLAFTSSGLSRMGLPETAMDSFSPAFREGMYQEDRLRRLGDRRNGKWQDTVISGGPRWSGNRRVDKPKQEGKGAPPTSQWQVKTPVTVHAMLLAYFDKQDDVQPFIDAIKALLDGHDVKIAYQLPIILKIMKGEDFTREYFGFADGVSQPIPFDAAGHVLVGGKESRQGDLINGVPLGEILMGYENGHRAIASGPVVSEQKDDILPPYAQADGLYDLGRNGTYMVARQLNQNVATFWNSLDEAAAAARAQDPGATHITADWLAERIFGRTRDGNILRPGGHLPPGPDGRLRNDFLYHDADLFGTGCPLGSHARRANPRDALSPQERNKWALLQASKNHRIIRRARKYGTPVTDPRVDDGVERGLLFLCLNTDITRQFEFVQQTWMLNNDFATLFEETDPLIGPEGDMTLPENPLRRRIKTSTFVQMTGGEYFFLPGLRALNYLAAL